MAAKTTARDTTAEIAFLTRALKAPTLRESVPRLAERARAESWTHEEFLAACLQREVAARESHGGEGRIRAARFPARKSLEEFDYDHARGLKRDVIAHLGTLDFTTARENVVFLGPPGTGKTHLAIALAIKACQAGHRVAFATAQQWIDRLEQAQHRNALDAELRRLERYSLLVVDEIGYLPLERQAANLLFALVARRYERGSIIVTRQQRLRGLGRDPRRRDGRRCAHRPTDPPRPHHHPQGQELPTARAGQRGRAGGRDPARRPTADDLNHGPRKHTDLCTIRFLKALHFSVPVDTTCVARRRERLDRRESRPRVRVPDVLGDRRCSRTTLWRTTPAGSP
jgi:DNA replication protein DnaC